MAISAGDTCNQINSFFKIGSDFYDAAKPSIQTMHTSLRISTTQPSMPPGIWRAVFCALCANLIGVGIARFSFSPLLPALVSEHWFDGKLVSFLAAANLTGYLAGALVGKPIATVIPVKATIRGAMSITCVALLACSFPSSYVWFFSWRLVSGITGGILMVLAAASVLPHVPASRRGSVSGVIFSGMGLGIVISGTLVPLMLDVGLTATWLSLAALALLLTALAWTGWLDVPHRAGAPAEEPGRTTKAIRPIYWIYGLTAAGWVPHMVFLVAFVAHRPGLGIAAGSMNWVVFGMGASVGPLIAGKAADRIGFKAAITYGSLIDACFVLLPAFELGQISYLVSSFVVGAVMIGTVPLVLGRIHELIPDSPQAQRSAWGLATVVFAVFQASTAYAMSLLLASFNDFRVLFVCGSAAIMAAFVVDIVTRIRRRTP